MPLLFNWVAAREMSCKKKSNTKRSQYRWKEKKKNRKMMSPCRINNLFANEIRASTVRDYA